MTILDIVADLDRLDTESTIYAAEPWTKSSTAIVNAEPYEGQLPEDAKLLNLNYFLEIFIAHDFLSDSASSLKLELTLEARCERLIEYALNDA